MYLEECLTYKYLSLILYSGLGCQVRHHMNDQVMSIGCCVSRTSLLLWVVYGRSTRTAKSYFEPISKQPGKSLTLEIFKRSSGLWNVRPECEHWAFGVLLLDWRSWRRWHCTRSQLMSDFTDGLRVNTPLFLA